MGTHPSCPARLHDSSQLLSDFLSLHTEYVGVVPAEYSPVDLPFLFKVLSVRTALSIQAHPDKDLALQLHASRPDLYKDPNHKPEMVIALTDFECLSGFRPSSEILSLLIQFPEFSDLLAKNGI